MTRSEEVLLFLAIQYVRSYKPNGMSEHANFLVRTQVNGTIHWTCPDCGNVNMGHQLGPWRVLECSYRYCKHVFEHGSRLRRTGTGRKHRRYQRLAEYALEPVPLGDVVNKDEPLHALVP